MTFAGGKKVERSGKKWKEVKTIYKHKDIKPPHKNKDYKTNHIKILDNHEAKIYIQIFAYFRLILKGY